MQTTQASYNLLGYQATKGQLEIVGAVLDPKVKRLMLSCMTRYGKTRFVAIGLLLLIANTPIGFNQKPKRIIIIAPTSDQTKILRGYISEHIGKSKTLSALLDEPNRTNPEHLKTEISKQRLTFKNNWELITLTAYAGENENDPAPNLMGWGGDIIVIDDACLIRQTVYTTRISRMLGDDAENSKLILIVNPFNMLNFAWEAWQNPLFRKIHVGWRQALAEGRTTQTYLDEQKALLSDYEWTVLYESNFANESEDTLIRYDWIQRAVAKQIQFTTTPEAIYSLDVAEQGADKSILTEGQTNRIQYNITRQTWIREKETMPTANAVADSLPRKTDILNVDSIGVGAGVYSRLKELGYNVNSIRVSEAATKDPERYLNQKSQRFWMLRTIFEYDNIHIPNDPILISQLSRIRYKFTAAGKIQIIDPEGKSPDYSDSLMLLLIDNQPSPWYSGV
jgi:hypothetical protein